jgi:hypothetical protein
MRSELSIVPRGGTIKPAINNPQPTRVTNPAIANYKISFALSYMMLKIKLINNNLNNKNLTLN